jgi:hypothetical protein
VYRPKVNISKVTVEIRTFITITSKFSEILCSTTYNQYFVQILIGPKRNEVTGERRKRHNEELLDLYSSPNILQVIKSRRVKWAGHVARMGRGEACTGFWWENLRERDHWGGPGVDGRIILRRIFRKRDVRVWTGMKWLRIGKVGGYL